jgi:polysaccharide chain length determinant protein (PEP-CTERM system associated)
MNEQITQIYGYLHGMWRFRWSALIIAWLVAVAGMIVVLSLPDKFKVVSTVYVDTTSVMKPLLKGLAPEMDTRDELAVMNRVLLSRENLLSVMRDTDMDLKVGNIEEKEDMLDRLRRSVELDRGRQNIYELSYSNRSGELAYEVVSRLLDTMIEDTLKATRTDTATAQKFLDTQIAEYEVRLADAEQQLAEFKKENVGYMPDEKGSYYSRLQRAKDLVDQTKSQLKLTQQRLAELKKQLGEESPTLDGLVGGGSEAELLRQYEERLRVLQNSYTDRHPDIVATKSAIEELKSRGEEGEGAAISNPRQMEDTGEINPVYQEMQIEASKAAVEVETLKIQLADYEKKVEDLKGSIDVIPEVEAKLTQLNRDYEITRQRYLDLVQRRESAKLAESAGQSSSDIKFRIIDPPVVPTRPSGPPRILFMVGVLIIAVGAGLAWSFLRFMIQPTYFDLEQVTEKTGLPLLGTVGLYMTPAHRRKRRVQLVSFLSAACMLFVFTASVMLFNKEGSGFVAKRLQDVSRVIQD